MSQPIYNCQDSEILELNGDNVLHNPFGFTVQAAKRKVSLNAPYSWFKGIAMLIPEDRDCEGTRVSKCNCADKKNKRPA